MDAIREAILEHFVSEIAPGAKREALARCRNLINSGYLDSVGLHSLLAFLQHELDVVVDEDDINPDTFATIDTITSLAKRAPRRL